MIFVENLRFVTFSKLNDEFNFENEVLTVLFFTLNDEFDFDNEVLIISFFKLNDEFDFDDKIYFIYFVLMFLLFFCRIFHNFVKFLYNHLYNVSC